MRLGYGILLGLTLGLLLGVGGYTFIYARGASYLTNNPHACANCHVMQEQYSGWLNSSHRAVAVCNDCHTPHDVIGKYTTKASAIGRGAVTARRRPASEDDVGGLHLCHRLPRGARPRVHA